jgi:hypothetical protein
MNKIILIAIMSLCFVFLNCNNDDDKIQFESIGKILGLDPATCPCCGGLFLEIEGDETLYRIGELPVDFNDSIRNASFPIRIKLNWRRDENRCEGFNYVIVEDIELN